MKKIKNLLKNRMFIGALCIGVAAVVAFVALPAAVSSLNKTVRVLRASRDIAKGQIILPEDLETVEAGVRGLPDECVSNTQLVAGKTAATDIKKNDFIFLSKVSDDLQGSEWSFRRLDGSKLAMSVTIDSFAAGLSGKLENGDIVRVIVYRDRESTMPAELSYVKVIAATTRNGIDRESVPEDTAASDKLPTTVTFLVNDIQASMLADFENSSKIHICLVYRGDEKTADRFLQEQENYFSLRYGTDMT